MRNFFHFCPVNTGEYFAKLRTSQAGRLFRERRGKCRLRPLLRTSADVGLINTFGFRVQPTKSQGISPTKFCPNSFRPSRKGPDLPYNSSKVNAPKRTPFPRARFTWPKAISGLVRKTTSSGTLVFFRRFISSAHSLGKKRSLSKRH
ncbi:hypothetical protein ES705_48218 [subsurface metagenome]